MQGYILCEKILWGKKIKNEEFWEKMKKGKEKREENCIKTGKKALKMHLFVL